MNMSEETMNEAVAGEMPVENETTNESVSETVTETVSDTEAPAASEETVVTEEVAADGSSEEADKTEDEAEEDKSAENVPLKPKKERENPAEKKIREYFEANASEDLKARVKKEGKTAHGALEYAGSQARHMASSGNFVCVDDDTVYGWCMHYFEDVPGKNYEKASTVKVATAATKEEQKALADIDKKIEATKASAKERIAKKRAEDKKAKAKQKYLESQGDLFA